MVKRVKKEENTRLAKNFHRTFIPEKQYIGALLKYAAGNGDYEMQAIADATGIPTGLSSGKAMPTADYCIGMGLVKALPVEGKKQKLALTDFGRNVFLGDKFFREELTQWLVHLLLCDKNTGAEVWYQLFWNGATVFGNKFSHELAMQWLGTMIGGKDVAKAAGPLFGMYANDASFALCGAVLLNGDKVTRKIAPLKGTFSIGYAAWLAQGMEKAGRAGAQVTVEDLERTCGFRSVTGWSLPESQKALAMMEERGLISVDRHMMPWLVCFKSDSIKLWSRIFEECI